MQRRRYWWLPYVVLEFDKNEVFVEVQTTPQHFEKRKLKTGLSDGVTIEVVEGLNE